MRISRNYTIAAVLTVGALALSAVAAQAHYGHRRGGEGMMPFFGVLQPAQREQMRTIIKGDKTKLELLHKQMRTAREALTAKLLSQDKKIDVSAEVAKLKEAQAAMLDERIELAMKARALLSESQLAQASDLHAKLKGLHEQERALMKQAHPEKSSEQ